MGVRTPDPPRLPKHVPAKNAPHFTLSNKDIPKTCPILDPNLWRRTFQGVCNTPLHGYVQNLTGFRRKSSSQGISGRMLLRPTRVRAKFDGFHISASGYAKNAPDFTLSNKDSLKTHPVLGLNLRRRTFRGVCFCALHGYMKNPPGSTFPHTDAPKTHPILPSQIGVHPKPTRF